MPSNIQKANLPMTPFDGQEFIDFRRIKWKFSKSINCWLLIGPVPEVPLATPEESGLLRATDKLLIDTLPQKGGGFGILAQPLLSVVPIRKHALYKGITHKSGETPAGSKITVEDPGGTDGVFEADEYAGKMIYFTSGVLKTQYFLIFTNDTDTFYIMGKDSSVAKRGDKFEIYDPASVNENGVIQGPIELVSETLDITCVDGTGNPVDPGTCNVNTIMVEDPANPPGLDIRVSENFKKQFCLVQPGAQGSRGNIGDKGEQGDHGTGDGPTGDQGLSGESAPEIGGEFTGIKFVDLDDIYDTAVVAMELDGEAGQLHVVKAKIRTPDDSKAADQIVASAVGRDVRFTDAEFDYELIMSAGDPIGVADVEIMHYPQGFSPLSNTDQNSPGETEANVIKLSTVVDAMVNFYDTELERISKDIDENQIKPFIEAKDQEARTELNARADEVARCEWDMPIEFCLGITPENCEPTEAKAKPFPIAATLLGPEWDDAVAVPLPPKTVPVTPVPPPPPGNSTGTVVSFPNIDIPGDTPGDTFVPTTTTNDEIIQYNSRPEYPDDNRVITPNDDVWYDSRGRHTSAGSTPVNVTNIDGTTTLIPAGYIMMYSAGAGRTNASTWTAEVSVSYADENGNSGTVNITDADEALLSFDKSSFTTAQSNAQTSSTAAAFVLDGNGEASMSLFIEGEDGRGTVTVQPYQVFRNALGAPMEVTQTMNRAPDGEGGQALVTGFSGELDCPDCPACPPCGDMSVDCGDVNCPECGASVVASSAVPDDGFVGDLVTITGSGFGATDGVVNFTSAVGGVPGAGTIVSWSNTEIRVQAGDAGAPGAVNVEVQTATGESATFPNMWEQA